MCLNGLNIVEFFFPCKCVNLSCSLEARLGSLLASFDKQPSQRHHKPACSFALSSPWELVRVVKEGIDRHLQKWMGQQGDQITKVF